MISDLEAKATILFANRAKRLMDAMRAISEPSESEPKPPPKTPKETRAQRREKEKYGDHPRWRRGTSFTFLWEKNLTPKDRRRGLKWLVRTLKEEWNASPRRHGDAEKGFPSPLRGEGRRECEARARGEVEADDTARFSLNAPWERDVPAWALPCNAGRSIEDICVGLAMSRARLTTLTKEYCGLTAQELIDGFRIGKLKNALVVRLRAAARELWGPPGTFAYTKLEAVPLVSTETSAGAASAMPASSNSLSTDLKQPRSVAPATQRAPKRSMFFRSKGEDFYKEERGDEMARRTNELAAKLRDAFEIEAWAVHLGFASAA